MYVGRIIEEKGLEVKGSRFKIFLKVIGSGLKEKVYKKLAEQLLDRNEYEFTGFISKDEIFKHYKTADLLVLPSRSETFGLVLLEANYCGLPVIATNVMGVPDVVKNNENGLLVEPNPQSIAEGIEKLLVDEELYNSIKAKAKKHVQRFLKERIFREFLEKTKIRKFDT